MASCTPHKRNGTTNNHKLLPSTLKQGDIVLLTQARVGVVRYIGAVDGKSQSVNDHLIGIEIRITDGVVGDNNGTYNQKTYFKCNKQCGLFIEPQQIVQIYTPEELLEMIIGLKDKLLPLLASKNGKSSPINKNRNKSHNLTNRTPTKTVSWPSNNAPTMSYIKEEEDIADTGDNMHWNVQINSPALNKKKNKPDRIQHGIYWSGSNTNLNDFHKLDLKATNSTFDDVDMNITAPRGLLNFFENDGGSMSMSPTSAYTAGLLSPITNNKKHLNMRSRVSFLKAHSAHLSSSISGTMIASYQKLKLLHRCVTLRRKTNNSNAKSLVLDLAKFGLFLKNEDINEKHKWYETIWNKYDKLFKFKIDFYFVNELLSDLLNEYLIFEYDEVCGIENIMPIDLKKALQQIIIHIRPYHIEQHQTAQSPSMFPDYDVGDELDDDEEDEMPFTFMDFRHLGHWLHEIEEMEEDDEFDEDYFVMDIHYWDFVQYLNSHKFHVWKKVINKLLNTNQNNKHILHRFNKTKMSNVLKACLCDYGRNGLGNVNMEIYQQQIKEYTLHLTKLFNEYYRSQQAQISRNEKKNHKNINKKNNYISKKVFFEFVSCIPSL